MNRADLSIPGFRHRTHEPEYQRLGLPFCRRDYWLKLSVLLEEEALSDQAVSAPDEADARNPKGLPAASA